MEAFFNHYGTLLVNATLETIYMTAVSTFFSYILGVPLGVALSVTKKGGIAESPVFNNAAGWVVNILRSVPFIILMVFLIYKLIWILYNFKIRRKYEEIF